MRYPTVTVQKRQRQVVDAFAGYNHNLRIGDGEFFEETNLTSDLYPVMATRKPRGLVVQPEKATGLIVKDSLCWVDGSKFVMNGYGVEMGLSDEGPKQLVSMGAYVIILPDKKYINTLQLEDRGYIEASVTATEPVTVSLCTKDGGSLGAPVVSDTAPESPENWMYWIDSGRVPHVLRQYSEATGLWTEAAATYVKISAAGIGIPFEKGDGVEISGVISELCGSHVLEAVEKDSIVISGIVDTVMQPEGTMTVKRTMPRMDFVVECGNRLWGCRYGPDAYGNIVNEIYCSKLGDFKNWNVFQGISTDSWVASVGTDGPWTGAVTHLGYPVFLKSHCLHKVYPSAYGAHQIQDTACEGVQQGSHRSLAIVGTTLFYKGQGGVYAYDGSLPVRISAALGDAQYRNAVAGATDVKYYISMQGKDDGWQLFVFDTVRGIWHREDGFRAVMMCQGPDDLLAIDGETGAIVTMQGGDVSAEEAVPFLAETGELMLESSDKKYIQRLTIRMRMEKGAEAAFYLQYDLDGVWVPVGNVRQTQLGSFSFPIRARRCDHLRLRVEGVGDVKIYSITKTFETGSEL